MGLKEELKSLHTGLLLVMLLGTKKGHSGVFRLSTKSREFLVYDIEPGPKS